MGLISGLADWAQATFGPYGVLGLIVLAVTEAVFSPVPPDALLPVLAAGESMPYALYLGVVTTLASVVGGAIGYWVGDRFSPWVHERYGGPNLRRVERWYQEYGEWVVLVAGFSPLPFKVFALSSGLLGLRFWPFIAAALVGRGLRFIPEALLSARYGEAVLAWTDEYEIWLLVPALLLLVGIWLYSRHRGGTTPTGRSRRP